MKVLVIGGGGREHALVWALRRSPRVTEVVCAPGNAGIAALARCVPALPGELASLLAVVERERPDLVVVGPEQPLALGLVDALEANRVRVFGPTRAAAQLETSKAFAKEFMSRWGVPTARYAVCRSLPEVRGALPGFAAEVVVKADGLAAGKGVVLCATHAEAERAAEGMFDGTLLGRAAASLVLEETLAGPEVSYFALSDGNHAATLAFAQDHKRVGEGDTGPNTGGMGAYSTDTLVSAEVGAWMLGIAQRVVDGMRAEGMPFRGVLFTGFMLTAEGPKVLEFNTRFGDPETQAILPRLESDLLGLLEATIDDGVAGLQVRLKPGAGVAVVAASAGYPGAYPGGLPIARLSAWPAEVEVFHAGTALVGGEVVTAGGRVLAVASVGASLREALDKVYAGLGGIHFEGMQYRRDIGWRALG